MFRPKITQKHVPFFKWFKLNMVLNIVFIADVADVLFMFHHSDVIIIIALHSIFVKFSPSVVISFLMKRDEQPEAVEHKKG